VGPLSDAYGRRIILLISLVIYTATSIAAPLVADMPTLTFIRAVQAMGAGGASALMILLINDRFNATDTARTISLILMVAMAIRIGAPVVGYQVINSYGWHSLFACFTVIGIVLAIYFAPHNHYQKPPTENKRFTFSGLVRDFRRVLNDRASRLYIGAEIATSLGLFAYVASASSVMTNHLGISAQDFRLVFAGGTAVMMVGAFINNRIVAGLGLNRSILLASVPQLLIAGCLLLFLLAGINNKTLIAGLILSFLLPMMMVRINANTGCLKRSPKAAGAASSLHNTLGLIAGAGAGMLCSSVLGGSPLALASFLFSSALASLTCAYLLLNDQSPEN
jgi:DHA1 family bicyclomycin/chloramphenicol resistance-like MFS transporter